MCRSIRTYDALGLLNPIMPYYIITRFKDVIFVRFLPWAVVVDNVGHAVLISVVGNDADVIIKNDNIATLPLLYLRDVGCKAGSIVFKINPQVFNASKIDINIWLSDVIIVWVISDVVADQCHQIIASVP